MRPHPVVRRSFAVVAMVALLWLAWEGLGSGLRDWSGSSAWQRAQLVSQLAYGTFAILSILTAFTFRDLAKYADLGFIVAAGAAAGLAAVVWGEQTILTGVASGVAALAIAAVIIWLLRLGTRLPVYPPTRESGSHT
jgi:hypothetical protein